MPQQITTATTVIQQTAKAQSNVDKLPARKRELFKKIGYEPLDKAVAIHLTQAQIIVLLAAMRSGKSTSFVPEAVEMLTKKQKQVWVVGLDYEKTSRFLFGANKVLGMSDYLRRLNIPGLIKRESKREHELELSNGSKAVGKSVKYPESFVAEPVDLIVLEDASSYPDGFYDKFIRPRVADTGGRILINSVPPFTKSSWLTHLYNKSDGFRTQSFTWGMHDNSYLSKDEIQTLMEDMPEYLRDAILNGQVATEDSSIFGNIQERIFGGFDPYIDGHVYQAGLDIGKVHDRTVLTVSDLTIGRCVFVDRFPPRFFKAELVEQRVLNSLQKYGYPNTYVDISGIGEVFRETVEKHEFFIPFVISTNKIRNEMIEDVAIAFQRGYTIPDYNQLVIELQNLEVIFKTGYRIYKTRSGYFDDCIMSLALSLRNWARRIHGNVVVRPPIAVKGQLVKDDNRILTTEHDALDLTGEYLL